MITGAHHVAIIVSSEQSVLFYGKLGFKEVFRKKRKNDIVVVMEGYGFRLEIFVDPNHPLRTNDPEPYGVRHLALKVDNLEETMDYLEKVEGLEFGPIMSDWTGVMFCFTKDIDGLPIELHE